MEMAPKEAIEARIKELTNLSRVVGNTLNLINDFAVKPTYFQSVGEIITWLESLHNTCASNINQLNTALFELDKGVQPAVVEAGIATEVVSAEAVN